MLLLKRKYNESVVIDVNGVKITVQVVELGRADVKLGFSAPKNVVIHRSEVWEAIEKEDRKAK